MIREMRMCEFHPFHSINPNMPDSDAIIGHAVVQSEENPKARLCRNRMCSLKSNVMARGISPHELRKPIHCQELLDREMRKLHHPRMADLDYHDQGRSQKPGLLQVPRPEVGELPPPDIAIINVHILG